MQEAPATIYRETPFKPRHVHDHALMEEIGEMHKKIDKILETLNALSTSAFMVGSSVDVPADWVSDGDEADGDGADVYTEVDGGGAVFADVVDVTADAPVAVDVAAEAAAEHAEETEEETSDDESAYSAEE